MNKTKMIAALSFIGLVSCVSATVAEPAVCDTQSVTWTFPAIPSIPSNLPNYSVWIGPYSTTTSFDFSNTLNKVSDVADNLMVQVTQFSVANPNGNLSWVGSVTVQIAGTTPDTPQANFATYSMPASGAGTELPVDVLMSGDTILQYLESGPVTLTVTLNNSEVDTSTLEMLEGLNGQLTTTAYMCVSASRQFSKSL